MIQTIKSNIIAESYESVQLSNGLRIYCYSMPNYNATHAMIGTNFGSIDRNFSLNGKEHKIPAGVAHFLEHKMFEKKEHDVFDLYAQYGASANAFTTFDKTCYIFTATSNISECLDILLYSVNSPYFTKETVEKEMGIISQEIKMYDDNAYWRLLFGVLNGLYVNHTIKDDIAGTVESIHEITDETLYTCSNAFYSPSQMILAVAGNITMQEILSACEKVEFENVKQDIKKITPNEPKNINYKEKSITMPISEHMVAIGYKENFDCKISARHELIGHMILETLTGSTSDLFNRLYDKNLVNGTFGGEVMCGEDYFSTIFSGETSKPDVLVKEIEKTITELKQRGLSNEEFTIIKNSLYGSMIVDFENAEEITSNMLSSHFKNETAYHQIETLKSIKLEDVNNQLNEMFCDDMKTVFTIKPMEEDK